MCPAYKKTFPMPVNENIGADICAFICQDIVLYTAQMAVLWHAYILLIASLSLEQC